METAELGRRAVLELGLIEGRRELSIAQAARREYDDLAIECRAQADELRAAGKHSEASAMTAASVRYRCRVIAADVEIRGLLANVSAIEAELARDAEPVVLTRDMTEGADEMAGLL